MPFADPAAPGLHLVQPAGFVAFTVAAEAPRGYSLALPLGADLRALHGRW